MSNLFSIRAASAADLHAWAGLRMALWPDEGDAMGGVTEALRRVDAGNFLALAADGRAIGFAEATLRHDYVNGTSTSPVGFLEGWYVQPHWRGRGVGRALQRAVLDWTREQGCSELASDSLIDNLDAHAAHAACGFEEAERVVYFHMQVPD